MVIFALRFYLNRQPFSNCQIERAIDRLCLVLYVAVIGLGQSTAGLLPPARHFLVVVGVGNDRPSNNGSSIGISMA